MPEASPNMLIEQTLVTVVPAVFCFVHLLLFAFSPKSRDHLYFALFTACFAGAAYLEVEMRQPAAREGLVVDTQRLFVLLLLISLFRFSNEIRNDPPQRRFRFYLLAALLGAMLALALPALWTPVLVIGLALCGVEFVRAWIFSRKAVEGVWILGLGLGLALLGGGLDLMMDIGLLGPVFGTSDPWLFGGLALLVSMSVYVARKSAQTQHRLELKLVEVQDLSEQMLASERAAREQEITRRVLEADNERKTAELEEARRLQLGMLPRVLPQAPGYEIAATMITATEVGGDYYDFEVDDEGVMTVVVGDAVGHGARAGTLVAVTKSLVSAGAIGGDPAEALVRFNASIRRMAIDRALIALLLARFDGHLLEVASAAMPPPLVGRSDGTIEEIQMQGLPLGSAMPSAYRSRRIALEDGDTVLLMSDGFPELRTPSGEEIGYEAARAAFARLLDGSPGDLILGLEEVVRSQTGGAAPSDDVTFVVVRVSDPPSMAEQLHHSSVEHSGTRPIETVMAPKEVAD